LSYARFDLKTLLCFRLETFYFMAKCGFHELGKLIFKLEVRSLTEKTVEKDRSLRDLKKRFVE